ncbi:exosortase A [Methylomonas lenta]|uniref:Exosortase A n=1 Tax=Methylomonas lenta TaxID=980561 RepID=A0A177NTF6_9GAMM|nr:exosortase A [Methylomonas lenta]OAI20499.1 exosortase A [Methylomonas lenta]
MLNSVNLPRHWQKPLMALFVVSLGSIIAFYPTWTSIVSIWERSETFAHGYLVVPISLWLIWLRRANYRDLRPSFSWLAVFFVLGCGFLWLVADLVSVLVIRQWAVVGILVGGIWAVLGNRTASQMLFPLLFLFLMVPFGEEFIPWLMDFTADFVVGMLRLTGISVYREGTFFTLTSGNWSVVEGCSGLRYVIASFTLGTVYAYLNYTSYKKRAIFMLAAFLTPILANGLRAYMIVMIGHLSSMKLATGVDHIIYGWVFFGLVMLLMFYVGSFWQDHPDANIPHSMSEGEAVDASQHNALLVMLVVLICMGIWPVTAKELHAKQMVKAEIPSGLIKGSLNSELKSPDWGWEPQFKGVMADLRYYLDDEVQPVAMYFVNFGDESQGGELINSQNYLARQKDPVWRIVRNEKAALTWPESGPVMIDESVLNSTQRDLFVLRWYRVGKTNTSNPYYAKWLQLLKRLTGDASPELMIVLYTQTPHGNYDEARNRLIKVAQACCM